MGGKKKKNLTNRLARMSDDERAKYLQHRAEIEEEAKRRKEQLISTFMKKKIKKEDGFARLNLAKINQNWHQLLRKAKCKEMKENVQHMKTWMDRVYEYKNRTILRLLEELEEAEEQYSNNFQSHSTHIDNTIESQNEYINKLQKQYDDDLLMFVNQSKLEFDFIKQTLKEDQDHLQTILYTQTTESKKSLRELYEDYMLKLNEYDHMWKEEIEFLQESRESISGAIWKQIARVVHMYVQRSDSRRMHFAELKRLDFESATEISKNQEIINREEDEIKELQYYYKELYSSNEEEILKLEKEIEKLNKQFIDVKRQLQIDIELDNKKLKTLISCSKQSTQFLNDLLLKGEQIKMLAKTCQKFETEREKVTKFLPLCKIEQIIESGGKEKGKLLQKRFTEPSSSKSVIFQDSEKLLTRPNTSSKIKSGKSVKSILSGKSIDSSEHLSTPESRKITVIKEVKLEAKKDKLEEESDIEDDFKEDFLEKCFKHLNTMEHFWLAYNKIHIDFMEMKNEKRILNKENKDLRGMIRAILEQAVLNQSTQNSKIPTRASSKRSAYSAPVKLMF